MFCKTILCKNLAVRLFPLIKELSTYDQSEDMIQREIRLWDISQDISIISLDEKPDNAWPVAVKISTWASSESNGFSRNVDLGLQRGDSGRSWCIMQIHIINGVTPQGWNGNELILDRTKCIKAGIDVMNWSEKVCKNNPMELQLAAYASGRCDWAHTLTKNRWNMMKYLERKY